MKRAATILLAVGGALRLGAAVEIDERLLPPPATNQIEFARDIKPILESTCFRCHSGAKPKNHFNLTTRATALKGGEDDVDILPGDSAKSPLIHYVARLVEFSEMPPEGKGAALTPEQIGLLRAWIDQGVAWETNAPEPEIQFAISPTLGWTAVRGDERKFREQHWTKDGWNGGAEEFQLSDKLGETSRLTLEGRARVNDYSVLLTTEKDDVGFARFGWQQYRKYSDDTGGYSPNFSPSSFSLDRDLHLDIGRAWIDFGLTLPDWPRIVLGYEHQYREGEKSTLQWGPAVSAGGDVRNIYPASKAIDERVHILKLDVDHEIGGVRIEESFRGEFYDLHTRRQNVSLNGPLIAGSGGPSQLDDAREGSKYFQGANTLRLEKQIKDWWLASAGYLYSRLRADATFSLDSVFPQGAPAFGIADHWETRGVTLGRETHAFSATSLLGPWKNFTLTAGVQSEWTRETGVGAANQDLIFLPGNFPQPSAFTFDSNVDKSRTAETLALRCTAVPFTVLFADARLEQEGIGLAQEQVGGLTPFLGRTDATSDLADFRAGFSTSPWRRVSLDAHYRRRVKENDYDHLLPGGTTDGLYAYPNFIRRRESDTDEVAARLTLRPCAWLKTSLDYKYEATEFHTATEPFSQSAPGDVTSGDRLQSADSAAHTVSAGTTLTPWRRLYFSGTFSYQNTRLAAFANSAPSVVPYRGGVFSVLADATYAMDDRTDFQAAYSFSWADYGQHNFADGLPVGMRYEQHTLTAGVTRRLGKNISAKLQYGFYNFDEPGGGGANNYTAHAVFGVLAVRIP